MGLSSIESAIAPKPPSMHLDKGSLAPRQPFGLTNSRPVETPAAVFTRSVATLAPDVYTGKGGEVHFNSAQGAKVETRVTKPSPNPPTPLKNIDLTA